MPHRWNNAKLYIHLQTFIISEFMFKIQLRHIDIIPSSATQNDLLIPKLKLQFKNVNNKSNTNSCSSV